MFERQYDFFICAIPCHTNTNIARPPFIARRNNLQDPSCIVGGQHNVFLSTNPFILRILIYIYILINHSIKYPTSTYVYFILLHTIFQCVFFLVDTIFPCHGFSKKTLEMVNISNTLPASSCDPPHDLHSTRVNYVTSSEYQSV